MTFSLTQHDFHFIQSVNDILDGIDDEVVHYLDNKTFTWAKNIEVEELFLIHCDCHYVLPKDNLKTLMINALIEDITQNTSKHKYHIYSSLHKETQMIVDTLLDVNSPVSEHIKLNMLTLFNEQDSLYHQMLFAAHAENNWQLMLTILEKGINYKLWTKENSYLLDDIKEHYKSIQGNIEDKILEINFCKHIKNSQIEIDEAKLIQYYVDIFPNANVNFLYNEFNIQKEELCSSIQKSAYSRVIFNLNLLANIQIGKAEIHEIREALFSESDLPKFFPHSSNKTHVSILIQTNPGENHNEEKIIKLFETLVAQKYDLNQDKRNNYKKLLEISHTINEQVYLDNNLNTTFHHKKSMIKI